MGIIGDAWEIKGSVDYVFRIFFLGERVILNFFEPFYGCQIFGNRLASISSRSLSQIVAGFGQLPVASLLNTTYPSKYTSNDPTRGNLGWFWFYPATLTLEKLSESSK
jgi:hypothetical protein